MSKIAIIPARGGSKRIPKKNIKNFLGKPIIAYSIETALKSNLFDEVMVSTDSEEIAKIAKTYGAKVPFFRSKKNADDFASTVDVLLEVLNYYEQLNIKPEYACCIYPTAPFLTSQILIKGFDLLEKNNFDTVFPVVKFGFPIQRAIQVNTETKKMAMFQPQYINSRSQDLETAYHDVGQFYWFKSKRLLEQKKLWTENTGVVVISETEAQDIDTLEDWHLAEIKYKLLLEK